MEIEILIKNDKKIYKEATLSKICFWEACLIECCKSTYFATIYIIKIIKIPLRCSKVLTMPYSYLKKIPTKIDYAFN